MMPCGVGGDSGHWLSISDIVSTTSHIMLFRYPLQFIKLMPDMGNVSSQNDTKPTLYSKSGPSILTKCMFLKVLLHSGS